MFQSHLYLGDPSCIKIEFKKQIATDSAPCYSVAWYGEKVVCGAGRSLRIYNVNGNKEKGLEFGGKGIPCVRNAGAEKLAILHNKDALGREVRISRIAGLTSNHSITCKFIQENNSISHISVSSTHIAACDVGERNIKIFNREGEQVMCLGSGKIQRPYGVLLLDNHVLVTDCDNKCLWKFCMEANTEPVWTCYGLQSVTGICSDQNGVIYAVSGNGGRIYLISAEGKIFCCLLAVSLKNTYAAISCELFKSSHQHIIKTKIYTVIPRVLDL